MEDLRQAVLLETSLYIPKNTVLSIPLILKILGVGAVKIKWKIFAKLSY